MQVELLQEPFKRKITRFAVDENCNVDINNNITTLTITPRIAEVGRLAYLSTFDELITSGDLTKALKENK